MCGIKKILLVAAIFIIEATAQWQFKTSGNPKRQRRFTVHTATSQQPPSQHQFSQSQQWNDYRSRGQWGGGGNSNTGYQQQQQSSRNLQQRQRHQNLVDYPFTVEYVDRRAQSSSDGSMARSRKRFGSFLNAQNDENLVDYPFTIEYVNNMDHFSEREPYKFQASMRSNQDSFQFRTPELPYQHNHHQRRHSPANYNGDPSLGDHRDGSSRPLLQW